MKVRNYILLCIFILNPLFLCLAGSISGIVIDASSSNPISGIWVTAATRDWSYADFAQTQADGTYSITNLPADEYFVQIDTQGTSYSDYISEWYNNAYSFWEAIPVIVPSTGDVSNVNFTLEIGGSISGRVLRASDNQPIAGLFVDAEDINFGGGWASAQTDINGNYTLKGLYSGKWIVRVDTSGTDFVEEYYNNVYKESLATPVDVMQPNNTSNIDFLLDVGGYITGLVKDNSNTPLSNISISAYDYKSGEYISGATTIADGTYQIKRLYSGDYRVCARPTVSNYVLECYDESFSKQDATSVNVIQPNTISGINFILSRGGAISGNVRDKDTGEAIYDCRVVAYNANTGEEVSSAYPDSLGTYNIIGLYTGEYIVCVELWEGTEYIPQCYENALVRSQATPVSITAPNTHNIWFRLQKGGSISGTVVTDFFSNPISRVILLALYPVTGELISTGYTLGDGKYKISGLPSGNFVVYAWTGWTKNNYASEYYDNALTFSTATPVNVAPPQEIQNINFTLSDGGSISGTVTYGGKKVGNIIIGAFYENKFEPFVPLAFNFIEEPGSYKLNGIPGALWYVAAFLDTNENLLWDRGEPFGVYSQNPVAVIPLEETTNIDIVLSDTSPNRPPVLDQIGDKTVEANTELRFTVTASDPDGDILTFSATNLPQGATFDSANALFTWTPAEEQVGTYPGVTFFVSDTYGGSDSESITITVNPVSQNVEKSQGEEGCGCNTMVFTTKGNLLSFLFTSAIFLLLYYISLAILKNKKIK